MKWNPLYLIVIISILALGFYFAYPKLGQIYRSYLVLTPTVNGDAFCVEYSPASPISIGRNDYKYLMVNFDDIALADLFTHARGYLYVSGSCDGTKFETIKKIQATHLSRTDYESLKLILLPSLCNYSAYDMQFSSFKGCFVHYAPNNPDYTYSKSLAKAKSLFYQRFGIDVDMFSSQYGSNDEVSEGDSSGGNIHSNSSTTISNDTSTPPPNDVTPPQPNAQRSILSLLISSITNFFNFILGLFTI